MLVLKLLSMSLMSMIIHHGLLRVSILFLSADMYHWSIYIGLYSVSIAEDTSVGTTILTVTATDEDVEPNNFTCYRLLNQVSGGWG